MKTILFDLDGTLIDSTEAILESFKVAFNTLNQKYVGDEAVLRLIGLPLDKMFLELNVKGDVWKYVDAYKKHYRQISTQKTKLLPFAKEAVLEASKFARLGIVTTKTSRYSKILMENFGLMDRFEVLIGREDIENPKPHPEPILKALHLMKANKEDAFMVGDTCLDMLSAKDAGVFGVGVEFNYDKNLKSCAKIVKRNVLDAVRFIKDFKC